MRGSAGKKTKKRAFLKLFPEKLVLTSLLILMAVVPFSVHAGFFSALKSLFNRSAEAETRSFAASSNSQNVPLLQAAVNPDPNPSKGGGDITIVDDSALLSENGPSGTIANISEGGGSNAISVYVVRPGDTLGEIAKMYQVSINTIVWANDIKNKTIQPGDTLVILPVTGVRHTVKKGDTLASIAKKYKAELKDIADYNGLTESADLAIGDLVVVPDGELSVDVTGHTKTAAGKSLVRGATGPNYSGYYTNPAPGSIRTQGLHGYNGVDLGGGYGSPIVAAASGKVLVARNYGYNGGYGQYIVIQHANGTQTLYAHLSGVIVFAGATVEKGQTIGYLGNSGRSTGPHLHFEVRGAKNPF